MLTQYSESQARGGVTRKRTRFNPVVYSGPGRGRTGASISFHNGVDPHNHTDSQQPAFTPVILSEVLSSQLYTDHIFHWLMLADSLLAER